MAVINLSTGKEIVKLTKSNVKHQLTELFSVPEELNKLGLYYEDMDPLSCSFSREHAKDEEIIRDTLLRDAEPDEQKNDFYTFISGWETFFILEKHLGKGLKIIRHRLKEDGGRFLACKMSVMATTGNNSGILPNSFKLNEKLEENVRLHKETAPKGKNSPDDIFIVSCPQGLKSRLVGPPPLSVFSNILYYDISYSQKINDKVNIMFAKKVEKETTSTLSMLYSIASKQKTTFGFLDSSLLDEEMIAKGNSNVE